MSAGPRRRPGPATSACGARNVLLPYTYNGAITRGNQFDVFCRHTLSYDLARRGVIRGVSQAIEARPHASASARLTRRRSR